MSVLTAATCVVLGVTEVWTASAGERVFPFTEAPSRETTEYRVYAARGEWESFQIAVRADNDPLDEVRIETEPVNKLIPAPEVFVVDFVELTDASPRAFGTATQWPDPLTPYQPIRVEANQARSFWLTYHIPATAKAGVYIHTVSVIHGKRRKTPVRVTVEVFDFAIPETPTLRSLFHLNRAAVNARLGIADTDLEAWRNIYSLLGRYRLSYRVWDGGGLVPTVSPEADVEALADHIIAAVSAADMNTVALDAGIAAALRFPEPPRGTSDDPLARYVTTIQGRLASESLNDRTVYTLPDAGAGSHWAAARAEYARIDPTTTGVRRLFRGPLHPYFEGYAEIWAVPLAAYNLNGHQLVRDGRTIATAVEHPVVGVAASSTATERPGLGAVDAYDGSFFTSWRSRGAPRRNKPEWLHLDFASPVDLNEVNIGWEPGFDSPKVTIRTSSDGRSFQPAAAAWSRRPPLDRFDFGWSEAALNVPKNVLSLRLEFDEASEQGLIGVAEVTFGRNPTYPSLPEGQRISPWLNADPRLTPSMYADADPVEFRMIPWVCWGHDLDGFAAQGLNDWPTTMDSVAPIASSSQSARFLFYPGTTGLRGSIRAELLRDGIEDYEYLVATSARAKRDGETDPGPLEWTARRLYPSDLTREELEQLGKMILEFRVRMGRQLGNWAEEDGN